MLTAIAVLQLRDEGKLTFTPGERFGYSNPAYVYLGRIIEQLSGDPWDGYVHKNIFAPLGLQRSYGESTILGHTGGQASFHGYLFFNRATSTGVIYAFNTVSDTTGEKLTPLRDRVYDLLAK
ncbi:MAG TPA: serine hydrolase [Thermoanaerobaculia bacterium]|nr:serine hydrolase [Thermoanaerobaculia bacterium]